MSFILDALKKSETDRQRHTTPGIADIPHARDRPRPQRWLWIVGVLLAINLVVLAGILLLPVSEVTPVVDRQQPAAADPPVTTATESPFAGIVAEARRNRPEREPSTTTEPQRNEGAAAAPEPRPAAAAPVTSDPAPRERVSGSPATFDELRAAGRLQLPDLHLDVHVYSEQPADRFVFINMSKYKERASLQEGPRVKEITPEGVILEQAGTTFLLPRQ